VKIRHLGPQNDLRSLGVEKLLKIVSFQKTMLSQLEKVGGHQDPTGSIPITLGNNGLHCVECPHQMRKFLLNLAPGEPHALVQELPCFDNPIKLDPLLVSDLNLCVHDLISGFLFHAVRVELCWFQLFFYL
jgi:hypothetical protein